MKSLIAMILLSGTFLGGYYLGQQPEAPDIFGWARTAFRVAGQAGESLSQRSQQEAPEAERPVPLVLPGPTSPPETPPIAMVEIDGELYRIGER